MKTLTYPKKSHPAWNKGKKMEEYSSKETIAKFKEHSFKKGQKPMNPIKKGERISKETEFKKGGTPHNKVEVGTIKIRKVKNTYKYDYFIKIKEPNIWITYWQYVWEQANGSIPKGMVIHHINGNHHDNRLENLICITKKEHINLHRQELINGMHKTEIN